VKGFIRKYPFQCYLVGGQVRDQLLGLDSNDYDFVVLGETPESLISLGLIPVGKSFPVFLDPETKDEYALARKEIKTGHGHREFSFVFDPSVTLEEDLIRRDFTINALCMKEDGVVLDFHHGLADLKNGVLRHISAHFVEDPLRVFRAAKFAARLNFTIAKETIELLKVICQSGELAYLSKERICAEFNDALNTEAFDVFVEVLSELGLWDDYRNDFLMIKELSRMKVLDHKWIVNGALSCRDEEVSYQKWQEKYLLPNHVVKKAKLLSLVFKLKTENFTQENTVLKILQHVQDGKNDVARMELSDLLSDTSSIVSMGELPAKLNALFDHFKKLSWSPQISSQDEAVKIKIAWLNKFLKI
jgi:tRNA nucleotidyltransferase/poly(A) polymerase